MARAERLIRLFGLLPPLAVRLLQLRDLSRRAEDMPGPCGHRARNASAVLAAHVGLSPSTRTLRTDLGQRSHAWEARLSRGGDGPAFLENPRGRLAPLAGSA